MKNINYQTLEYNVDFLVRLADQGVAWAKRELRLNGYADHAEADAGEDPKQRV